MELHAQRANTPSAVGLSVGFLGKTLYTKQLLCATNHHNLNQAHKPLNKMNLKHVKVSFNTRAM